MSIFLPKLNGIFRVFNPSQESLAGSSEADDAKIEPLEDLLADEEVLASSQQLSKETKSSDDNNLLLMGAKKRPPEARKVREHPKSVPVNLLRKR